MILNIDVPESAVRAAVDAEILRRVTDRLRYHDDTIRTAADARVRAVTADVLGEVDIKVRVEKEIRACLDKILSDTVRTQVRNIVRLAVHQELAAQKAEFTEEPS